MGIWKDIFRVENASGEVSANSKEVKGSGCQAFLFQENNRFSLSLKF